MLEEREIISILDSYAESAISTRSSELSEERSRALDAYNMRPYGDESDTSSKVVTSEVFNIVEQVATMLVKIFTSTDKAVEFIPEGPEDVEAADQKTKYCNYIFYRENNGFLVLYNAVKDALIMKNGIIKVYPQINKSASYHSFQGLTQGQAEMLVSQGYEVISATTRQDFDGAPVYDLQTKFVNEDVKICVSAIPPEELSVSGWHDSVLLDSADYVQHRTRMSVTSLREMGLVGLDEDVTSFAGGIFDEDDWSEEELARDNEINDQRVQRNTDPLQKAMWRVTVKDIVARVDVDCDGIAERRRIIRIGNSIRYNEPTDYCGYGVFAPIIMSHRFIGKSYADLEYPWQRVQTALLRQSLNNIYLSNHQRPIVLKSSGAPLVDIDSLMTSGPGEPIYEKQSGALRFEAPSFNASEILGVSEIVRQQGELRTGVTRLSQGINPDAITKNAAGGLATVLTENSNERTEMLARVLAETCIRPVFQAIAHLTKKYQNRRKVIRIYNKFVEMDPSTWSEHMDMSVNVGLGSGTQRQTSANLTDLIEKQAAVFQNGGAGTLVNGQNIYNALSRYTETLGFKDPSPFFTDPSTVEPEPPKPTAEEKLLEAQVEIERMKAQLKKVEIALTHEQAKGKNEHDIKIALINAASRLDVERIKAASSLTGARITYAQATGHDILPDVEEEVEEAERKIEGVIDGQPFSAVLSKDGARGIVGGEDFWFRKPEVSRDAAA